MSVMLAALGASEAHASSEGKWLSLDGSGVVVPAIAAGMTFAIIDITYGARAEPLPVELAIAQLLIAVPLWSAMALSSSIETHTAARVLSGGIALWFTLHGLWSLFDAAASDESSSGSRTRPLPSSGRLRDVAP